MSSTTSARHTDPSTAAESPSPSGTLVHLDGVTKHYGLAKPAVDDITLTIEPGEFMTFLGPSGSGKTTTLNLIAGFEPLSSGRIEMGGKDMSTLPPHKRNLGMLFQNYALFPHMTVAQNVGYPLRERKVPKGELQRRVSEALELVQLVGRDDHLPSQLSGGQQQRVAFARAIVFNPPALLLDEPLGALDRNLRGALQLEIRRIHREVGSTFVFVTHDQEEAMNLSDRIALFNEGRIEQVGSPEQLYDHPETLFTARFLGDSNVFSLGSDPLEHTVSWEKEHWSIPSATVATSAPSAPERALIVRPEAVCVAVDRSQVPDHANSVEARIVEIEYLGSHRNLVLSIGDRDLAGRAKIEADSVQFRPGDRVTMWWLPERQRVVSA